MALSQALGTREFDKFEDVDGNTTVRVSTQNVLVPEKYDYVAITYPDIVTEVYTYKSGGSGGTTVGTLTYVYNDSTKQKLVSIART